MTDQQHPITPTPELVDKWASETPANERFYTHIATQAARWGADQELEACIGWLALNGYGKATSRLHAFRRPKPSLKEQALALVSRRIGDGFLQMLTDADAEIIRQALEALPND